jgi:hypothetical protein
MIGRIYYYGKWWLPDNPESSFLGTFTFSQFEGAYLNLEGFLINNKQDRFKNEIILGQTWDGLKITLCSCLTTSATGFNSSVVKAEWVFIGVHFLKARDIRFDRLTVAYSGINKLIDSYSFWKFILEHQTELRNHVVKFQTLKLDGKYEISILVNPLIEVPNVKELDKNIEKLIRLEMKSLQDKTFEQQWFLENRLYDFLNFILSDKIFRTSIDAFINGEQDDPINSVHILYKSAITRIEKNTQGNATLFMYGQALNRLQELIKRWFEIENNLQPIYNLFFGGMYNQEMYIEFRFLGYTQALEVYHRLTMDHNNPQKIQRAGDIQRIKFHFPEYKDWLNEIFANSFSMSFQERATELFEKYHEIVSLYFKYNKKNSFLDAVRSARNYYTHYSKKLKEKVPHNDDFFWLTKDVELLLRLCILSELGYDIKTLNDAFYIKKLAKKNNKMARR